MNKLNYLPESFEEKAAEKWQAFSNVADEETLQLIEAKHLTALVRKVFSLSDFISENCFRFPLLLKELILSEDLSRTYPEGHYHNYIRQNLSKIRLRWESHDLPGASQSLPSINA